MLGGIACSAGRMKQGINAAAISVVARTSQPCATWNTLALRVKPTAVLLTWFVSGFRAFRGLFDQGCGLLGVVLRLKTDDGGESPSDNLRDKESDIDSG